MNLVCIRHPHYHGKGSPDLTCKTCCTLYIKLVKEKNETLRGATSAAVESSPRASKEEDWLLQKKSELEKMRKALQQSNARFHPGTI